VAAAAGATAIALLWISATPVLAQWYYGGLEARYPPTPVEALPDAPVAIVLGGALGPALPPRLGADLGKAADRVLHGARLYRAGKVQRILVAAGNVPWVEGPPEGELIADLLVELGVPREAILLDLTSRNTRENAIEARRLMETAGIDHGLLVTSAGHMRRALAVFEHAGVAVVPASTDVEVVTMKRTVLDWLPDAEALALTTRGMKEHIGYWVYGARGWL
jgi:uncharacterized SAM-binding protein YcdF (DUF218 family)